MTTKDKILFTAGFLLIFSLASPAFAQAYPITLYADQSSAGAGDTVKFTITWLETSVVKIDFTKVEFQYKKLADSTWTTFSATEGTSERLSLVLPTRGGSGTMREFTAKMSGAIGEQTAYQFRVRDRHYPAGSDASAPVTLTVSNKVVYGAYGALKIIPGSGYTTSGAADAYVKVKQGNQLGTGVKILYDFSIENQGSGGAAGQTFLVTVISNDATLSDSESDRNSGSSIFKIISVTRPDGTVEAGSGNSITLLPGRTTLRMEVEAPSDIAPGVQAYRVVTFRATNIAAKNAGQNVKAEASARITADTIRDCVDRLDPTVSVTPPSKVGDPGQTLMYTIVVKNQDTGGCEPRTVNINKIGLQQLLPPASDYDYVGEGARRDDNGMKWGIVLRGIFNGKTTDITYRQGGTFTEGFTDYVSFSGSGATFRLSPADASGGNDRKVMILKVTSYVGETKASQRGVRICTSDGCGAQSAVFDLQNPFDPKRKPSQSGETVSDSVLTDPDKNLPASSGTGGTGGGGGGTVGGVPIVPAKPPKVDLDPTWLANCKACAVQPNKGFNTDTQACAEGDAGGSGKVDPALKMVNPVNYDNKASNGKDNWIFLPTENSRQIIKDTARKKRAYTCEKPPKGVGLSSSTGNSPIVSSGCSSKTSCSACTPDTANSCGWSVKQAKCITGTASGSNDGSSGTGDWTWYTTEATRGSNVGMSCEKITQTAAPAATSSCSSKTSCTSCTPSSANSCGWDKSANACKKGTDQGADDKSASIDKNNWVWYTTEVSRGSKAGMSCEKSVIPISTTPIPTTPTQPSLESCLACVKLPYKGYVSTTGKCESGGSLTSSESSASVSAGNWVYYSSDAIMDSVVSSRPDLYAKGLSCRTKFPG